MGVQLSKNNGGYLYLNNPKEQLMEMLVSKTRDIGHMLSFREACEDPEMIAPNNYAFYFGSFNEATKRAWKEAQAPRPAIDTSESGKTIPNSKKPPKKDKSPPSINLKSLNSTSRTQKYSFEKVKGIMIAYYKRNGRFPTNTDMMSDPSLPSSATIYKYLGHKREWEKLIPPSLREESAQVEEEKPPTEEDPLKEGSPANDGISFSTEPFIVARHHWQGDTMVVEISVSKPGSDKPILITLAV